MSLYTWHHQGPHKPRAAPPSCSILTGAELPQTKNAFHLHHIVSVRKQKLPLKYHIPRESMVWLAHPSAEL